MDGNGKSLPQVSVELSIIKKLSCLKANKAPGLFDPNIKLIKTFAKFFAAPLFSEIWKISKNVMPLSGSEKMSRIE